MASSIILILFVAVFSLGAGKQIDIEKEFRTHVSCRGKTVIPPAEYLIGITAAAAQCTEFQDNEFCNRICISHKYPELTSNGGHLNMNFIRKEARRISFPSELEEVKEKMIKRLEYCENKYGPLAYPQSKDEDCVKAREYYHCVEDKYQEWCKSDGPIKDEDSFLDDI